MSLEAIAVLAYFLLCQSPRGRYGSARQRRIPPPLPTPAVSSLLALEHPESLERLAVFLDGPFGQAGTERLFARARKASLRPLVEKKHLFPELFVVAGQVAECADDAPCRFSRQTRWSRHYALPTSLKHSRQSQAPNFFTKTWPSRSHGYDPCLKAIRFAHRCFMASPCRLLPGFRCGSGFSNLLLESGPDPPARGAAALPWGDPIYI